MSWSMNPRPSGQNIFNDEWRRAQELNAAAFPSSDWMILNFHDSYQQQQQRVQQNFYPQQQQHHYHQNDYHRRRQQQQQQQKQQQPPSLLEDTNLNLAHDNRGWSYPFTPIEMSHPHPTRRVRQRGPRPNRVDISHKFFEPNKERISDKHGTPCASPPPPSRSRQMKRSEPHHHHHEVKRKIYDTNNGRSKMTESDNWKRVRRVSMDDEDNQSPQQEEEEEEEGPVSSPSPEFQPNEQKETQVSQKHDDDDDCIDDEDEMRLIIDCNYEADINGAMDMLQCEEINNDNNNSNNEGEKVLNLDHDADNEEEEDSQPKSTLDPDYEDDDKEEPESLDMDPNDDTENEEDKEQMILDIGINGGSDIDLPSSSEGDEDDDETGQSVHSEMMDDSDSQSDDNNDNYDDESDHQELNMAFEEIFKEFQREMELKKAQEKLTVNLCPSINCSSSSAAAAAPTTAAEMVPPNSPLTKLRSSGVDPSPKPSTSSSKPEIDTITIPQNLPKQQPQPTPKPQELTMEQHELNYKLISSTHNLFLHTSLPLANYSVFKWLEKFDLSCPLLSNDTQNHQERLQRSFQILFKKSNILLHQPFTVQCDLMTVLRKLSENDKLRKELHTPLYSAFTKIWTGQVKILFKTEDGETIQKSIMECIAGSLLKNGPKQKSKLWTLSPPGIWSSSLDNERRALETHFSFIKFLRRSLMTTTPETLFLLSNIISTTPTVCPDKEEGGEILVSVGSEGIKEIFVPNEHGMDRDNYDFMIFNRDGQIDVYFISANFTRCTSSIMKNVRRFGAEIAVTKLKEKIGKSDEEAGDVMDRLRGLYDRNYFLISDEDDEYNAFKLFQRDHFRSLYKDYGHFLHNLSRAKFFYLVLRPDHHRRNNLMHDRQLVTRLDQRAIHDWLKSSDTREKISIKDKILLQNAGLLNNSSCNQNDEYNVDKCFAKSILKEFQRQNFLDEEVKITLRSLYVQKNEFTFEPIDKIRRRGGLKNNLDDIEETIFGLFELVQSSFSSVADEAKISVEETETYLEQLDGCRFQFKMMEMCEDFRNRLEQTRLANIKSQN